MVGKKFNKLTVLEDVGTSKDGHSLWLCQCDCGNQTIVVGRALTKGTTKSCGCWKSETSSMVGKRTGPINCAKAQEAAKIKNRKHGEIRTRLYHVWLQMRHRCRDLSSKSYGAKGIKVCDEWMDFLSFKSWATENGYDDNLTIDRINPNSDYKPDNCRWITKPENSKRIVYGKRRFWAMNQECDYYCEFDCMANFVRAHPESGITQRKFTDFLRGKTHNLNGWQAGEYK